MTFLNFLIQVNIYLTSYYIFYILLLKNETFFVLNRIYLITTAILSLLIPTMQLDWVQTSLATQKASDVAYSITLSAKPIIFNTGVKETRLPLIDYLKYCYLTGVFFMGIRFLIQLVRTMNNHPDKGQAYSFFKKVNVSPTLTGRDAILRHEYVHVKQLHSADIIFFELLGILNWFNPIVYSYQKAIRFIHEFIADKVTSQTEDPIEYSELILSNAFGLPQTLSNNFFNKSLLKQRILMLHKPKSRKVAIIKYGFSLPLFAGMLIFSSAALKAGTMT